MFRLIVGCYMRSMTPAAHTARSASAEASSLSVIMSPSKLRHMAIPVHNASQYACRAALVTISAVPCAQYISEQ